MLESRAPLVISVQAAGLTDIGRVRKHNEDAVLLRDDLGLYIVADGAGGHNAGNVASALATTSITNFFENTQKEADAQPSYDDYGFSTATRRIARAIQRANRDIIEIAKSSMRHRGMGTTVVAVWVRPTHGTLHIGHVGDSRCYRYRGGQLEQLTQDHSLYNDVLELQPDMPDAALARLPRNVVTRALGMEDVVRAAVQSNVLLPGDRYLLCSDGLTAALTELEMTQALESEGSAADIVRALIGRANECEAQDNLAALVLLCDVGGEVGARPRTAPFPPARLTPPRPAPHAGDESWPEIVILGTDYAPDDPSSLIHVVPQESATDSLLSAIDSFVGPIRARAGSKPSTFTCASCGALLSGEDIVCPHCNAPQPLA